MIFVDDRTPEMKDRPHMIVLATDKFMSGWGEAKGGPSFAGWAVTFDELADVCQVVRGRREMKNVRLVGANYRPPGGPGHCHIYVHSSLKEEA